MDWSLAPALAAAGVMTLIGIGVLMRPASLGTVGLSADTPLGTSEIRAVFGGMFVALGFACIVTREPVVFAVVGSAWLADFAVRSVSVFVDRVPIGQAVTVLGIALVMGALLVSGYILA